MPTTWVIRHLAIAEKKAIQAFFTEGAGAYLKDKVSPRFWDDITHFEGNANAFRLLTHRFLGRREGGFVMTYSTLASIVKYPFSSSLAGKHGKFGFFRIGRRYIQEDCQRTWNNQQASFRQRNSLRSPPIGVFSGSRRRHLLRDNGH